MTARRQAGDMPYLPTVIIVVFAVFFHRAAEFEQESTPV
jgi:hypothetical protein